MGNLTFEVTEVAYSSLANCGNFGLLDRLTTKGADALQYPLLGSPATNHVSNSLYMDPTKIALSIGEQNQELPTPDPGARYIVGGQQAGLLSGPLYTILKAISIIGVARLVSESTGHEVLPLFWIAAEDHDVLEVNRFTVNGQRYVHDYDRPILRGQVPQVGDISLVAAREPILQFLSETLPKTEFTEWAINSVAEVDFSNYLSQFRGFMHALFSEWHLRYLNPLVFRRFTSPVIAAIIERWEEAERALCSGSDLLRKAGIDPPIQKLGLFEIVNGNRKAVRIENGKVWLSDGVCTLKRAAETVLENPFRFSPGAALRPVCQDAVIPVTATVGGPSELAYLWQVNQIHAIFGSKPSLLFPRISATFLGPGVARAVRKTGLSLSQLFNIQGFLQERGESGSSPHIESIMQRREALLREIDLLEHSSTPRWLRRGREAIESGSLRIIDGLRREQMEREGLSISRLEKINEAVLPGGKLQERVVNVSQFLNLHGPEWIRTTMETLEPFSIGHQITTIQSNQG